MAESVLLAAWLPKQHLPLDLRHKSVLRIYCVIVYKFLTFFLLITSSKFLRWIGKCQGFCFKVIGWIHIFRLFICVWFLRRDNRGQFVDRYFTLRPVRNNLHVFWVQKLTLFFGWENCFFYQFALLRRLQNNFPWV